MDDKNKSAIDKLAEGLSGADVRGWIRRSIVMERLSLSQLLRHKMTSDPAGKRALASRPLLSQRPIHSGLTYGLSS
jgi:hypothetical protein